MINLPTACTSFYTVAHAGEKEKVYPETTNWVTVDSRAEFERRYPLMPDRIIDNLLKPGAKISVVPWDKIVKDVSKLRFLIDRTYEDRHSCDYDLSRPMRRSNS